MKKPVALLLIYVILSSCSNTKNNVQKTAMFSNSDMLVQLIDQSKKDTGNINPQLKKLQQESDLVIAFASLNYAWVKRGTYRVLANHNNEWKLYFYQASLSPSNKTGEQLTPLPLTGSDAENIKKLYAVSDLWSTNGDEDGNFCAGKKDCNINDAETWTITAATSKNIHTTTYYAPHYFETCCPGNAQRKRFVALAEEIIKLTGNQNQAPENNQSSTSFNKKF